MSFSTKDGKKKFGSGFVAKRYDLAHSTPEDEKSEKTGQSPVQNTAKKPSENREVSRTTPEGMSKKSQPSVNDTSMTKGMHMGDEGADEHNEVSNQESRTDENGESESPEQVVAEHGKANSVTVHHDHAAGTHKVVSHHPDGHMHESSHPTPEAAHQHASKLGSMDGGNSEAENDPDSGNANLGDLSSIFGGE